MAGAVVVASTAVHPRPSPPNASLCSTLSAAVCAFNISPLTPTMPLPQVELVAAIMANLFRWGPALMLAWMARV